MSEEAWQAHDKALRVAVKRKRKEGTSLSLKEAAYDVLSKHKLPLSSTYITGYAQSRKYFRTQGLTPDASLSAQLYVGIRDRGDSFAFGMLHGRFYQRSREDEILCNVLISSEYQGLGMRLFQKRYKYIPPEAEHRFLCWGLSTISPSCGLGLFVREGRCIPAGCIVCEYDGIRKKMPRNSSRPKRRPNKNKRMKRRHSPDSNNDLWNAEHKSLKITQSNASGSEPFHPYAVTAARNTSHAVMIDGMDSAGTILSLASLANDAGPCFSNTTYVEFYDTHPGKVFLVATKLLGPGTEIFVQYGPKYWGIKSYPTLESCPLLSDWVQLIQGDTCAQHPIEEEFLEKCEKCSQQKIPKRLYALHLRSECGDTLCSVRLKNMNSLPHNDFTTPSMPTKNKDPQNVRKSNGAITHNHKLKNSLSFPSKISFTDRKRAMCMVDTTDDMTLHYTHDSDSCDINKASSNKNKRKNGVVNGAVTSHEIALVENKYSDGEDNIELVSIEPVVSNTSESEPLNKCLSLSWPEELHPFPIFINSFSKSMKASFTHEKETSESYVDYFRRQRRQVFLSIHSIFQKLNEQQSPLDIPEACDFAWPKDSDPSGEIFLKNNFVFFYEFFQELCNNEKHCNSWSKLWSDVSVTLRWHLPSCEISYESKLSCISSELSSILVQFVEVYRILLQDPGGSVFI